MKKTNNKQELEKLETKYNKYIGIIKKILLIIIFVCIILLVRYGYVYSLMYNTIEANNSDKSKENCKITYSYTYKNEENNSTIIVYCKDGISVMKVEDFFTEYYIDNKKYSIYDTAIGKTYSINDFENRNFETITTWERLLVVFNQTNSCFNANIDHEVLNGEKCITLEKNNEKNWYNAENYLLVKKEEDKYTLDMKYENEVVTDEDISLPDLSEYEYKQD